MARTDFPPAALTLSKAEARRFLLAHQKLWPPRSLSGKAGVLEFIGHAGVIQYDPIFVAGRNADLVLQSRIKGYRREHLSELLYTDRQLLDGWDKVASIYLAKDRPYFARYRARMRSQRARPDNPAMKIATEVLEAIRDGGPHSSLDLKHEGVIEWSWGQNARLARACLETLYVMGEIGIHHRVGTRRVFELLERLLPPDILARPDPNVTEEAYQDWHVLRRVQAVGIANPRTTEIWLGIEGGKSAVRRAALARLVDRGELIAVAIDGLTDVTFFMRSVDLPVLEALPGTEGLQKQAALIAALDNLTWDRNMLRWVFDFDYIWEIYTPAVKRKYGYYVLPVLYGDRFIARCEPFFDRKTGVLNIKGWWWEAGVNPDNEMEAALIECLRDFTAYLGASQIALADPVQGDKTLQWISEVHPVKKS